MVQVRSSTTDIILELDIANSMVPPVIVATVVSDVANSATVTAAPVVVASAVCDVANSATVTAPPVVVASILDNGPESATDTVTGAARCGSVAKEKPQPSLDALEASLDKFQPIVRGDGNEQHLQALLAIDLRPLEPRTFADCGHYPSTSIGFAPMMFSKAKPNSRLYCLDLAPPSLLQKLEDRLGPLWSMLAPPSRAACDAAAANGGTCHPYVQALAAATQRSAEYEAADAQNADGMVDWSKVYASKPTVTNANFPSNYSLYGYSVGPAYQASATTKAETNPQVEAEAKALREEVAKARRQPGYTGYTGYKEYNRLLETKVYASKPTVTNANVPSNSESVEAQTSCCRCVVS